MCTADYSLKNGDKFTVPANSHENVGADLTGSAVCDSGFQIAIDGGLQCRAANKHVTKGLDGRAVAEVGDKCKYNVYNATADTDFNKPTVAESDSKCGFNKDDRAYCVIQPGDKEFVDIYNEFRKQSKDIKCHRLSGGDGSTCSKIKTINESDLGFKLFRLGKELTDPQAAANIANNDKCVAATVMSDFWQGRSPDSALTYGVFGVCASLVAFILF